MHIKNLCALLLCLVVSVGCQNQNDVSQVDAGQTGNTLNESGTDSGHQKTSFTDQVVEASCGQCQLDMDGSGCDLAVRIDGKSYFVDGSSIDDHGDAHGEDGLCNCIRKAEVSGEIRDGRFVATTFEVLPQPESND